jgi:hypothetical protein
MIGLRLVFANLARPLYLVDGKTQDLLWLVNVIDQWNHLLHIQLHYNADWLGKNTPRQHYMKTVPSEYNNKITKRLISNRKGLQLRNYFGEFAMWKGAMKLINNSRYMETKEKYISRVDNLTFISYDGNNRFILPKLLLRCLKTWMFCFVEDNKVISGIVKEIQLRNAKIVP